MPKRPPKPVRIPARIVRRRDSLDRPYYIHKETGRRVSRTAWTLDKKRRAAQKAQVEQIIARRKERKRQDRLREKFLRERLPLSPLPTKGRPLPPETLDVGRPPQRPFPPGVSETGVPEGVYDDDIPWFTVPDEDEYEEGTGR